MTTTGKTGSKKGRSWGKPGDVVTGRVRGGDRWTAKVGPSGKLIGKQIFVDSARSSLSSLGVTTKREPLRRAL